MYVLVLSQLNKITFILFIFISLAIKCMYLQIHYCQYYYL